MRAAREPGRRGEAALLQQQRFTSYQLADELRQTSDDLTRLARTYVATRDPAPLAQALTNLESVAAPAGEMQVVLGPDHYLYGEETGLLVE